MTDDVTHPGQATTGQAEVADFSHPDLQHMEPGSHARNLDSCGFGPHIGLYRAAEGMEQLPSPPARAPATVSRRRIMPLAVTLRAWVVAASTSHAYGGRVSGMHFEVMATEYADARPPYPDGVYEALRVAGVIGRACVSWRSAQDQESPPV